MKYFSSIASCSFGNILEWYDFGLFTIFSSLFSRLFFPTTDPQTAMIATISIFSIGFFCRPIGALVFGYLGDKNGRATTLRMSILMIVLPTLAIGCLPTYHQIGIVAPILLTIIRMWQGISIGGEYSGSLIYLAESSPKPHRAFFTSFANMGANLGVLLAGFAGIMMSYAISPAILETWGWRFAYIISGAICLLVYIFRLQIQETKVFDTLKKSHQLSSNPIKLVFSQHKRQLLKTIGMVCMGSAFYFFCYIYLPIYLVQTLKFSIYHISYLIFFLIGIMIILVPVAGYLCDRLGRRNMLLFNAVFIFLCTIPGFYYLNHFPFFIFLVMLTFTIASSSEQGATPIAMIENFPSTTRYTGVSLGYNIANGFLGGTVPIICEWLISITHFSLSPAFYITSCALTTLLVIFFFIPETKNIDLRKA